MFNELILALTQFGGGPGDPANNVVRFLLAAFFWSVLCLVSFRLWHETKDRRHLLFSTASVVGASRELFMFIAEYGSFRGYFPFESIFHIYPPLEHAVAILSIILMGYAFMRSYFNYEVYSRFFLIGCSLLVIVTYAIITPLWIHFLDSKINASLAGGAYVGAQFHDFPGDLIFRLEGAFVTLLILGAFLHARLRSVRIPWLAFIAFFCFFADDALQAFSNLAGNVYDPYFGPIRHNLHIIAIVMLVGVYWWEVTRQLNSKENFLNTLLDTIPDMISYKNRDDIFLGCNRNFSETLIGQPKNRIIGRKAADVLTCEGLKENSHILDQQVISADSYQTFEHSCTLADGRIAQLETIKVPFHDSEGNTAGVLDIARDITERRQLEDQLIHSQKLDAIGKLAGGVAHDFNNILAVMQGYIQLMQNKTDADHPFAGYLAKMLDSTESATSLVQNLMAFSRKQTISAKTYELNDLLDNFKDFLVRLIPEDIHLHFVPSKTPLYVSVDKNQLEQALTNLVANARDAMPKGGQLTISTSLQEWDQQNPLLQGFGEAGASVRISLADNGCGMDESTRQKIFEPFYTTKKVGKGTGLGLSIVYGIIKQNNGFINVTSEPAKGTTFHIDLPEADRPAKVLPKAQVAQKPVRGNETILIVEDQTDLREVVRSTLQEFGYRVISAVNGKDAIDKFSQQMDEIKLVLMDVVMPILNGKEAAIKLRNLKPGIKILFMSGYALDVIESRGDLDTNEDLLVKPIKPRNLLREIRTRLDQ